MPRVCRALGAWGALSQGIAALRGGLQMERGWSPRHGGVICARGGEEHAALAWVDRVILKKIKKIIFLMIALDGFQQVNYPQSFCAGAWRR